MGGQPYQPFAVEQKADTTKSVAEQNPFADPGWGTGTPGHTTSNWQDVHLDTAHTGDLHHFALCLFSPTSLTSSSPHFTPFSTPCMHHQDPHLTQVDSFRMHAFQCICLGAVSKSWCNMCWLVQGITPKPPCCWASCLPDLPWIHCWASCNPSDLLFAA